MESEKENLDNKYVLRDISPILISDETLTPNNLPRITQPSIGKYLVRVDGDNDYSNNRAEIAPKILDNWAARSRAFWVDKPGRNDFLQKVCMKFSGQIHEYSPKNNVHKMLFPRPISCELAYINEKRLCNVVLIEEMYKKDSTFAETAKITKDLIETPCEFSAPFWWETNGIKASNILENGEHGIQNKNAQLTSKRWRPIPDPIGQRNKTKCQRKEELRLVGQPFKHEACMFYNENYPAAKLKLSNNKILRIIENLSPRIHRSNMEKIAKENLFLLEFLVDKCIINPNAVPKDIAADSGETCVCFQFLDNDQLDVCEADFSPKSDYTKEDSNMKSGKSCLFALTPTQAEEASESFNIDVTVLKKMPKDSMPDKVQIGSAAIPVVGIFNEIVTLLQSGAKSETVSRTLKDTFDVVDAQNETIGSISAFIRMSCFGKLIVTQFQMNLKEKSVFFKDNEGKSLYKYRKATRGESRRQGRTDNGDEDEEDGGRGGGTLYCTPHGRKLESEGGKSEGEDDEYPECNPEGFLECPAYDGKKNTMESGRGARKDRRETKFGSSSNVEQGKYESYNMKQENYGFGQSGLGEGKGRYQEIGAEMNGNAIRLRIPKGKGKIRRLDGEDTAAVTSEDGFCENYPSLPSSAQNACCCSHTMRGKQMLSLKPADDPRHPFGFHVSGCPNGANNVTIVSPTNVRPDGMQVTELSDPNKDIFVLRIGKKCEGNDQKSNLELELITPKAVDRKPPPKLETRETQYFECDAGPDVERKNAKGGKKDGKKGGKKGKKGKK